MDAVRLAPAHIASALPRPPAGSVRAAVEWAVFAVVVTAFFQTLRGHMRFAAPAALFCVTAVGGVVQICPRRGLLMRAIFAAVAAVGATLILPAEPNPFGYWLGRGFLLAGTGLAVWGWFPAAGREAIRGLFDHLTAHPTGVAAYVVAAGGVAIPSCVLFLSDECPRGSGDTIAVVATIAREWTAGSRDLSTYAAHPRSGRWEAFEGQNPPYNMHPSEYAPGLYSAYPAGMEVFAWPVALAAAAAGADLMDDEVQARIEYRTAAGVTALALALLFLSALHLTDARAAYATTVAMATGSAFLTTFGHSLWQQTGVAFWGLVVLLIEVRSAGRPGWSAAVGQGVACGLMLACRTSAVTFLVPFGLWVLARDWRRGLIVPAVAAIAYAPFAVVYWELHRSLLGPSYILAAGMRRPTWEAASGVLMSPSRGLFVYQPMFLLLPLAVLARFRSPAAPGGLYPFTLAAAGLQTLLASSWVMWWGGHCYGSRLVSEVVPVLGLAVAPVVGRLLRSPTGRIAVATAAFAGVMAHYNLAYHGSGRWNVDPTDVDHDPGRLWDWSRPPFVYVPRSS